MKGETKKCLNCGKEFTAGRDNQKYCAPICGVRASSANKAPKKCIICGKEFRPWNKTQVTCGKKECIKENTRNHHKKNYKKYQYNKKDGITPTTKTKKRKPTAKEWEQLTPSQRWECMSLTEISAELARYHLSYGQAQVLKERRELPFDFGERREI